MSDLLQLLRNALPEALGGLTAAAVIAILGLLYKKLSRNKSKKGSERDEILAYKVDNINWNKTSGTVERKDNSIILHDSKQKTEMWGNVVSNNLDCVFVLKFDIGMSDSSVGLEIWAPSEYSLTFRGGSIRIIKAGEIIKAKMVKSCIGKRIKVHLKVSNKRLIATIDDVTIVDEKNTFWKRQVLKPRLNADIGDTITLYSSSKL